MEFNFDKNTVIVFSKAYKIDTVVNKLASLSGDQIHSFFSNRNVLIPRRLNCLALYSVLNKKLRFVNSNTFGKDYFERLQYYDFYTELQLFNLYKEIATYDDFLEYRKNLFKIVLQNYVALNFKDGEIQYLINLRKLPLESFDHYFENISCSCYEQENTFDGHDVEVLVQTLEYSASTSEIYALGEKYGIKLPTRLKKDEFVKYIYWYLEKNKKLTNALREDINNMTVAQLKELAKSKKVGMSVSLSKGELVRYFFFILSQYEIPRTQVKRLVVPEEYNPIRFEVKLENTTQFKTDEPKKVLFFEGEDLDKDTLELQNELTDIYNDVKEDEKSLDALNEQEVKTYELPKKEIKLVVVNQVSKDDLAVLKYSKVKGVDYKKTKASLKTDKAEDKVLEETLESTNEVLEEIKPEPVLTEDSNVFEEVKEEVIVKEEIKVEPITVEETIVQEEQKPVVELFEEEQNTLDTEISSKETVEETPVIDKVEDTIEETTNEDEDYDDYGLEENVHYNSKKIKKFGKFRRTLKVFVTSIIVLGLLAMLAVLGYIIFKFLI
jgi:hypothetical protein